MKIIFATGNKNKMTEIRQILRDLGMEILSMKEAGVDIDIVEDGKSFEENAMIKASAIAELLLIGLIFVTAISHSAPPLSRLCPLDRRCPYFSRAARSD